MEESNGVCQLLDPKELNRPSSNISEDADDIKPLCKISYSHQTREGLCSKHSGPWKNRALFLGLVCALLLCVMAVLTFYLYETKISLDNLLKNNSQSKIRYSKLRIENAQLGERYNQSKAEYHNLKNNCSNLISEKSNLQISNQKLVTKKAQLEERHKNLSAEYITVKREKSTLQISYQSLQRQKLQLQESYHNLTKEKFQLQNSLNTLTMEKDEILRRFCKERVAVTQHAVEVTLDPETACEYLTLSANGKHVVRGDTPQPLSNNRTRFLYYAVQGMQGFSSGKFYYEVQVNGKKWELGVVRESITKREELPARNPTNGYWMIKRNDAVYTPPSISPNKDPEMVGVFVDYEGGVVSFYDADTWTIIHTFKNVSFKKKIYPYFFAGDQLPLNINTPVSCVN